MTETLAPWQAVWRRVQEDLADEQLAGLRSALLERPEEFVQGTTVYPASLDGARDRPPERCCLLAWLGWQGGLATVMEVEGFFHRLADELSRDVPGLFDSLLTWWDDNPWEDVRDALLDEIIREQKRRAGLCASR